jgi:hypothetical protein
MDKHILQVVIRGQVCAFSLSVMLSVILCTLPATATAMAPVKAMLSNDNSHGNGASSATALGELDELDELSTLGAFGVLDALFVYIYIHEINFCPVPTGNELSYEQVIVDRYICFHYYLGRISTLGMFGVIMSIPGNCSN